MLTEMLGLTAERWQFILLGVAYLNRALTDEKIAEGMAAGDAELYGLLAGLVEAAAGETPGLDPRQEARVLFQVAAGLGVEVALGQTAPADAVATVDYYLRRLLG
ncbi:TetR family transcriptional regulator C-terminal domain-containing protein [Amycolatopsis ruanii]|uniref:TetR family transcriptional regulator C-terminal domain-containing protein n=1 Tax=Amycolatopsis ruanii TaxID=944491 RepID=UPI001967A0F1